MREVIEYTASWFYLGHTKYRKGHLVSKRFRQRKGRLCWRMSVPFSYWCRESKWAATWESVHSEMCAERRFKSACASAQFDQSPCCPHEEFLHPFAIQNAPSEDSDQTAHLRSLIWIFAGCTWPKVRFLTRSKVRFCIPYSCILFGGYGALGHSIDKQKLKQLKHVATEKEFQGQN